MKNNEILLIFDLDFTLIDNSQGIINSFNHALATFGHSKLPSSEIETMIGEPLEQMFSKYIEDDIDKYIITFRKYYSEKGITELTFLLGAREKIMELNKKEFNLAILTSKKQELAIKLIQNEGLSKYFTIILGATKERKKKNSPLLKDILKQKLPNIKYYCMIGDHPSDAEVSELLKCPFFGLLSGKSTKEKLLNVKTKKKIILKDIRELNEKIIKDVISQ